MNEVKKQKRQFIVILLIVFLGFLGISIPYLIFPALFLNPTFSILPDSWGDSARALFLGITLAAYPLGQFIGSPILGSLSDDYGRKPLLNGSLVIAAFCNLLTGFAIQWQMLTLLILSRFLAGVMEGNVAIARAMAVDLSTISKHDGFGKINATISIAFLIGPFLGGVMTDKELFEGLNVSSPFYLIGILFFALAGLSAIVIEKTENSSPIEGKSFAERINLFKRLSQLFLNKRLQFLLITSTCFTLAVDIFYEFGPVYLTVKWAYNPSDLIMYNAILCAGLAIGNGMLPSFFSSRFRNRRTVIGSIALFSLALIAIVVTNKTHMMLALFGLCGLCIGLAVTLLTVKISDSVSDTIQGEVLGTQLSLRVLGDAIICFFGGVLLLFSAKIILVVAAMIALSSVGYYIFRVVHH